MRTFRHKSLDYFLRRPMPQWGGDLNQIDFDNIFYFLRATEKQATSWDELPADIKNTTDRLGIPGREAAPDRRGGAQYESEVVYHKVREDLEGKGVLFLDTDTALKEHEELFREHWATVIPPSDNKFAALNSAVWSNGSFIWIPEGVHVEIPLQAYFRINSQNMGQFERTLIIAEPGSSVHYVGGLHRPHLLLGLAALGGGRDHRQAPRQGPLHHTIQNWSTNVYNLVTKRAAAYEGATMEWIDGNIGSKLTMKYPAVLMLSAEHAHGEILSVAFAGRDQHQDAGAKLTFAAPNTLGQIISKSISRDGGRTSTAAWSRSRRAPPGVKVNVRCDALLLDEVALRHLPYRRQRRTSPSSTGHRLQDRRRPAVLPPVAGPVGGRGHGHDRARVHRADPRNCRWSTRSSSTASPCRWKGRSGKGGHRDTDPEGSRPGRRARLVAGPRRPRLVPGPAPGRWPPLASWSARANREEAWRFTDPKRAGLDRHAILSSGGRTAAEGARVLAAGHADAASGGDVAGTELEPAGLVATVDGAGAETFLDPALAAEGVILTDLPTALREHAGLVEPPLHDLGGAVRRGLVLGPARHPGHRRGVPVRAPKSR